MKHILMLNARNVMAAGLMLAATGFMVSCDDDDDNDPNNPSPIVTLTGPQSGSNYVTGADITLTANAADDNGTISSVTFYEGENKIGEDTTAPFEYVWQDVKAGDYSITAVAMDNGGAKTTSSAITITVQDNKLIDKNWRLVAKTVNPARSPQLGAEAVTDWFALLETCEKDNLKKYNTDNTVLYDEGATKCESDAPQTQRGAWLYNSTNTIITETHDDAVTNYTVTNLTDTQLKVTYTDNDLLGNTYTYTETYSVAQ